MEITYKNIPNIEENYFAGSDGNVYSKKLNFYKMLKSGVCSNGNYQHVSLKCKDGTRKNMMVHVVVCLAFKGEKPDKSYQVRHLDGNSHNNLPDNLAWSTVKDNHADKISHGTDDNGLRNSRAKLSKEKLYVIRWLLSNTDLTHNMIAEIVKESREMISKVNNKSRYSRSHVVLAEQ